MADIVRGESRSSHAADRELVCAVGRDRRWSGCRTRDTVAAAVAGETGSPRIGVVFVFGECDKHYQGRCEGPPWNAPPRLDLVAGLHPPLNANVDRKKEYPFSNYWRSV